MRISAVSGWRGVTLIAITYVYFLIFAQFAFLSRLAELGTAELVDEHAPAGSVLTTPRGLLLGREVEDLATSSGVQADVWQSVHESGQPWLGVLDVCPERM